MNDCLSRQRARLMGAAMLLLAFISACGGDTTQPDVTPTIIVAGGIAQTVQSGTTLQLIARVTDKRAQVVSAPVIEWSSSDATIASIASNGVMTATTIGTATITARANGVIGTTSVTVLPGVVARLLLVTQPSGASAGVALLSPPFLELRDAAGNLASTATASVTVSLASGGGTLSGPTTAMSSAGTVTFPGLTITGLVGPRTVSFSTLSISPVISEPFDLQPGAAAALTFRTRPLGGGLNSLYATQPVIEVRDASTNIVTSATNLITASLLSGGGALTGSSVAAAAGVASFSAFGITGAPNTRTVMFATGTLTPATIMLVPCDLTRPPQLSATVASRAFSTYIGAVPLLDSLVIVDRNGSCTAPTGLTSDVTYTGNNGWLTASLGASQSSVSIRATPGTLAVGTYRATVNIASQNAGTLSVPVSLALRLPYTVSYGSAAQKINQLDPGTTLVIPATVRDTFNAAVVFPVTFQSRSPSIAAIASDGTITAKSEGQAWLLARVSGQGDQADSVYLNVTSGTGPLLRTDISRISYGVNTTLSVVLQLDTRGATVGAANVVFTWPAINDTPGVLRLTQTTLGSVGSPAITTDNNVGTARISIANATGMTGVITLAKFDFTAATIGIGFVTTRFLELIALDQTSLLGAASALVYPVVVR